ncbi:hypothetical protein UFOVP858_78 [uncultured Caudovirales phage]|jgi:hypothetical protein|uniref:Uncharacterized protein n=1 Tax=uncultured Caudovirales phage TaxID=2100421 RepID=A0A6J5P7U0_9CAUD|nr:hypothetical protein UFOVP858_78 [uncultured Caudovirales phage]
MGKGKSTEQTVTQQNIPKEFFPYFDRLLARTENESQKEYVPYQGERLAGTTGDTEASYGMIRDIATRGDPGRDLATDVASSNISMTGDLMSGNQPYQFSEYGYSPVENLDAESASAYMDPYLRNVLDVQKKKAAEDYEIARAGRNAAAVSAGAFGGSRQQIGESMAERDLLARQMEIEATGQQGAYADAIRRFEADRAAKLETEKLTAEEKARVQTGQSTEDRAAMQDQLKMMGFSAEQASLISDLEQQARTGDIQAAQLLESIGKSQQSQEQAGLDLAYEDFLRQAGFGKEQLGLMSGILQGLPIANAGETVQRTPYNPIQQALGAGLAGLSLYQGFQ